MGGGRGGGVTQESCRNNLFCKQDRATSGLSNEPFAFVYGGSYIRPIISRDLFICSSSDVSIHTTECRQEIFFRDKVLVQSKIIVFILKIVFRIRNIQLIQHDATVNFKGLLSS